MDDLQRNPNHIIYQKSNEFLRKYFEEDKDETTDQLNSQNSNGQFVI